MNIENFSTINLPGLADLGDTKNWASVGRGNLTSTTSTGIGTNSITISSSNPYAYGPIKTEGFPMSKELYLYI